MGNNDNSQIPDNGLTPVELEDIYYDFLRNQNHLSEPLARSLVNAEFHDDDSDASLDLRILMSGGAISEYESEQLAKLDENAGFMKLPEQVKNNLLNLIATARELSPRKEIDEEMNPTPAVHKTSSTLVYDSLSKNPSSPHIPLKIVKNDFNALVEKVINEFSLTKPISPAVNQKGEEDKKLSALHELSSIAKVMRVKTFEFSNPESEMEHYKGNKQLLIEKIENLAIASQVKHLDQSVKWKSISMTTQNCIKLLKQINPDYNETLLRQRWIGEHQKQQQKAKLECPSLLDNIKKSFGFKK